VGRWITLVFFPMAACAAEVPPAALISHDAEFSIAALSLRVPNDDLVSFSGLVNYSSVGTDSQDGLYVGVASLLNPGILIAGAVENHKQAKERKALHDMADGVLLLYRPTLNHFTNAELMQRALDALTTHGDKTLLQYSEGAGRGWLIQCSPEFFMTQDARALILRNSVVIHSPSAVSPVTFKNVVDIVGSPRASPGRDSEDSWSMQNGALLKAASVELLRESLRLALSELRGDFAGHAAAYHTVRYPRGGVEEMERAQILSESSERVVLRTLRGWIMSVPVAAGQ
jgi:hypothetical protein